jgi:hypothetical protein
LRGSLTNLRISPHNATCGNLDLNTSEAPTSFSQSNDAWCPDRARPRSMPPTPANNPATVCDTADELFEFTMRGFIACSPQRGGVASLLVRELRNRA